MSTHDLKRYSRQIRFAPWGEASQRRLAAARVAVIGCGALGTASAELLARAGVGGLVLLDRDIVERSNLQRQTLFTEEDARESRPKAEAARLALRGINSEVEVQAHVTHLSHRNIRQLLSAADLLLDGTDNFETRLLLNDYAWECETPWIYGACLGGYGVTANFLGQGSPCYRCLFGETPEPGTQPSCETAGILGPTVSLVAAFQAAEALKLLSGHRDALRRTVLSFDVWHNTRSELPLEALGGGGCPTCRGEDRPYLRGEQAGGSVVLCGRGAVQLLPGREMRIDLAALAERWRGRAGGVRLTPLLLRGEVEAGVQISVFSDGRVLVHGVSEEGQARAIWERWA